MRETITRKYIQRAVRVSASIFAVLGLCMSVAGCGTSDGLDELQANIDLSDVTKNDAIASLVSDQVAVGGVLTVGSNATWAPAEFAGRR